MKIDPKYPAKCPKCNGDNALVAMFSSFAYADCQRCAETEKVVCKNSGDDFITVVVGSSERQVLAPHGYKIKSKRGYVGCNDLVYNEHKTAFETPEAHFIGCPVEDFFCVLKPSNS